MRLGTPNFSLKLSNIDIFRSTKISTLVPEKGISFFFLFKNCCSFESDLHVDLHM